MVASGFARGASGFARGASGFARGASGFDRGASGFSRTLHCVARGGMIHSGKDFFFFFCCFFEVGKFLLSFTLVLRDKKK